MPEFLDINGRYLAIVSNKGYIKVLHSAYSISTVFNWYCFSDYRRVQSNEAKATGQCW